MLNKTIGEEEAGYYKLFFNFKNIFESQDMFMMYFRCACLYMSSVYFTTTLELRGRNFFEGEENVIVGFQTLSWELKSIILLIIEFYYIGFINLIFNISRLVIYYFMWLIIFQYNYEIVGILIDYFKLN